MNPETPRQLSWIEKNKTIWHLGSFPWVIVLVWFLPTWVSLLILGCQLISSVLWNMALRLERARL